MPPRLRPRKRIANIPATRSIEFTAHALARMADRGVSRVQVEAAVMEPLRTLPAAQGRDEFQSLIQRAGKPMLLRVIVEHGAVVSVVVTVIVTGKVDKYGGSP